MIYLIITKLCMHKRLIPWSASCGRSTPICGCLQRTCGMRLCCGGRKRRAPFGQCGAALAALWRTVWSSPRCGRACGVESFCSSSGCRASEASGPTKFRSRRSGACVAYTRVYSRRRSGAVACCAWWIILRRWRTICSRASTPSGTLDGSQAAARRQWMLSPRIGARARIGRMRHSAGWRRCFPSRATSAHRGWW